MTVTITFGQYGNNDGNGATRRQHRVVALSVSMAAGHGVAITQRKRFTTASGIQKSSGSVTTLRPAHAVEAFEADNCLVVTRSFHQVTAAAFAPAPTFGIVTTVTPDNIITASGFTIYESNVAFSSGPATVRATPLSDIVITHATRAVRSSYRPPLTYLGIMMNQNPVMYSELGAPTSFLVDSFLMLDVNEEQMVMALMDAFTMSDSMSIVFQALQQLFDKLSIRDIALLLYRANLIDSFLMMATPVNQAKVLALLADAFVLDDTLDPLAQVLAVLNSSLRMYVTLNTGQDTYSAWVMTPESKAVRSYSNYPFNSFIMLGTQYLAAGDAGVFIMGADDDALPAANTPIKARVRSGLKDFGTSKMKRIDRAYIGYKSSGTLCLRVCATLHSGEKAVYTYQMVPTTADAPVESRVAVGRGVRSVYWSFELCNDTDSSTFEMYDMRVLPMILSQRIP